MISASQLLKINDYQPIVGYVKKDQDLKKISEFLDYCKETIFKLQNILFCYIYSDNSSLFISLTKNMNITMIEEHFMEYLKYKLQSQNKPINIEKNIYYIYENYLNNFPQEEILFIDKTIKNLQKEYFTKNIKYIIIPNINYL